MKKISFVLIMATVFSIVTTNCKAQLFSAKLEAKEAAKAEKAAAKLNKANFKAAKDFTKQFESQANAQWVVEDKAITAFFKNEDVKTRVVYDKKGNWIHTIADYGESKMPADIRRTVKREYYDHAITQVQEIKEGNITFYVVHLRDGKNFKKVGVYDGDINVIEDFTEL